MPVPRYTTLISISQFRPIYVYFKPPSPHIIGNSILNILNLDLDHPHQNKNGGKKELGNLSIFRCYFKNPAPVEVGSRSSHYFCTGFIHPFGSFFPKLLKHQQLSWLASHLRASIFAQGLQCFLQVSGKNGGGKPPPEPTTWALPKKTPTFHWLVFFGDPDLSWVYQNPQKKPTWVGCHPHTFLKPPGSFFHCSPDHFYQPRNQSTEYALRSWRIKATWARGETRAPKKTQGGFGC